MESILASRTAAPDSILSISNISQKLMMQRFIDSTLLREWTVLSLIVAQNHVVLNTGELVLQKSMIIGLYYKNFRTCGFNPHEHLSLKIPNVKKYLTLGF